MRHPSPSLFFRLRRHRGLLAMAVAVMILKFVAGTVCLSNDPDPRLVSGTTAATVTTATTPVALASVLSADAAAADCVLGELGGCHCSCAHNVPLAVAAVMPVLRLDVPAAATPLKTLPTAAIAGWVHRPPIA